MLLIGFEPITGETDDAVTTQALEHWQRKMSKERQHHNFDNNREVYKKGKTVTIIVHD